MGGYHWGKGRKRSKMEKMNRYEIPGIKRLKDILYRSGNKV